MPVIIFLENEMLEGCQTVKSEVYHHTDESLAEHEMESDRTVIKKSRRIANEATQLMKGFGTHKEFETKIGSGEVAR